MPIQNFFDLQNTPQVPMAFGVTSAPQEPLSFSDAIFAQQAPAAQPKPTAPADDQQSFLRQYLTPAWLEWRDQIKQRPQFDEAAARRNARQDAALRSIGSALEFLGRGGSAHQAPGLGGIVSSYAGIEDAVDKSKDTALKQHLAMLEPHKDLGHIGSYMANAEGDVGKAEAAWYAAQGLNQYRQGKLQLDAEKAALEQQYREGRLSLEELKTRMYALNVNSQVNARSAMLGQAKNQSQMIMGAAIAQAAAAMGAEKWKNLTDAERQVAAYPYYLQGMGVLNARPLPFTTWPETAAQFGVPVPGAVGTTGADSDSIDEDDLN